VILLRRSWVLFLLLFLNASGAMAQGKFDFSNLGPELQEQIKRQFPTLEKGNFTAKDLDALVEEMIVKNQFDSAEVRRQDDTYILRVGKTSKIEAIEFSGNSSISEKELRREMVITEKLAFDQQQLIDAQDRLEKYYQSQGFSQVRIDFEFLRPKDRGVTIKIRVREGRQTTLESFEVISINKTLNQKLTRHLKSSFGGDALNERTLNSLRDSLRTYLSKNAYYRTEVIDPQIETPANSSKSKAIYRFQNVNQYEVYFDGQKEKHQSGLKEVLSLESFSSSNPNVASEFGTKIKSFYISQGFARVEVNTEESPGNEEFARKIYIRINEGPRIKISKIELNGTFSENPEVYQNFIKEHSSPAINDGVYVKEDLDAGLRNMVTDRWNRGFLKARIVSTRAIYNEKRDQITVQVNFEEGRLTQIRNLIFEGNSHFSTQELTDLLELKAGEPLRLYELENAIGRLYKHYRDQGYLDMSIANEKDDVVTYFEDNTIVDVRFKILEGPQVKVGSIVIEGNTLTKDEIILQELEFDYGNVLTPERIDESVSRLQKTGYFSSVEIRTLEEKTPISLRTVRVRVTDRDPGLLNFGFGFNNDRVFTVRGYGGVAYRNILGTGRGISARVDGNYNLYEIRFPERKFTIGYLEPYLFHSRMKFRSNFSLSTVISTYNADAKIASEVDQYTFSLEQNITSHLLVSFDLWNFANYRDFSLEPKPTDPLTQAIRIGSIGPTIDLDFRDHPFNPTKGTFTRVTLEHGSPVYGSNETISYIKGQGSFTHYQSLGLWRMIWANSVRGAYLKNTSSLANGSVPYDKKGLILGGQSTIRGFTPDEAYPTQAGDFPAASYVNGRYNLTTQAQMSLFKSEIRFPVYGNFGGAVFYDGGSVKIEGVDIRRPYRDSVGIGARYNLPVGAINVEYAWKNGLVEGRNESPGVLHISFGTF
jgi:outer membrane protein insertion porin family